jgi:hypothetical protein
MPAVTRLLLVLAAAAALLAAAPAAEGARRKVPQNFYGVMWDGAAAEASPAAQAAQWDLMARSGVESVRAEFSWYKAQPVAGRPPSFTRTDRLVELASSRRIRVLPVVFETPPWAGREPRVESPPARIGDYLAYLQALVGRYGPRGSFWAEHPDVPRRPLRQWQIWNEPHLDYYWRSEGDTAWAAEYAELLRQSNLLLKRLDPGSTTVLAGLADFVWSHLRRLYRAGIRGHFDAVTMNFFTRKPALVLKGVRLLRRELRKFGEPRKPLWLTETTWPASKGRTDKRRARWQRSWETTDAGMARRLRTFYAMAVRARRRLRLQRVYWYTWSSSYRKSDLFDYSGLVLWRDGTFAAQPALRAYAASARAAQGCRKSSTGTCR